MEMMDGVVLIVDDDPQIRSVFSSYLDDQFEVRTAESGAEALEKMDDDIDVVLLDRLMPTMAGEEVLIQLRDDGFEQPVAMVTAVDPDFDVLEMDFDEYIVKPVFEEELRDVVEMMILRKEYDDVIREYFALVSKVTALKSEKRASELEGNVEYAESTDRLAEIKDQAREGLDAALRSGKFDELFRNLSAQRIDSSPGESGEATNDSS